ncbi:MAG: hypothetical protein ACKN89_01400 [Cyanobium sp.]
MCGLASRGWAAPASLDLLTDGRSAQRGERRRHWQPLTPALWGWPAPGSPP